MRKLLFISSLVFIFNVALVALPILLARVLSTSPILAFNSEADNAEMRGYLYVVDIERNFSREITDSSYLYIDPVWSNDGQLAFAQIDPNTGRWNIEVSNWSYRQPITSNLSQYRDLDWSNNGVLAFDELGYAQPKGILLWDGATLAEFEAPFSGIRNPRWSPEGKLAFNFSQPGYNGLAVWDGSDAQTVSRPEVPNNSLPAIWSPDNHLAFLASTSASGVDIFVWDGVETRNITNAPRDYREIVWSHDGRIAFVAEDGANNSEIYVWDGADIQKISQNPRNDTSPRWSADGRLAFVSWSGRYWEIHMWDGGEVRNITTSPAQHDKPVWSANGWLAFLSRVDGGEWDVYVWDGNRTFRVMETPGTDGQPQWWPLPG